MVVTSSGAGAMVICRGAVAVRAAASVTLAVKLNVPAVVGVPDKSPAEERVSPPGNAPALTVQVRRLQERKRQHKRLPTPRTVNRPWILYAHVGRSAPPNSLRLSGEGNGAGHVRNGTR